MKFICENVWNFLIHFDIYRVKPTPLMINTKVAPVFLWDECKKTGPDVKVQLWSTVGFTEMSEKRVKRGKTRPLSLQQEGGDDVCANSALDQYNNKKKDA